MNGGERFVFEDWDEYFLGMAWMAAKKSKDARCQVGAVIASDDNVLLATGFNGFPRGVHDDDALLKTASEKLPWMCHAEANAIWNAARIGVAVKGTSIFVTKFPCLSCCHAIVQSGIRRLYTHDNAFWSDDETVDPGHFIKRKILREARIIVDAPLHPNYLPRRAITAKAASPFPTNGQTPMGGNGHTDPN
jgi:dCMP deaminase